MPRLLAKSQVKSNLDLWLNDTFLREGMYQIVSVGEADVYGRDISTLSSTSDATFADNRVWQSAFKDWVHESGITPLYAGMSAPIIASGVTVNGVFYPKETTAPGYNAAFGHRIDYKNGRIIFNSPIAANSTVKAEFSYKEISVDSASIFENEQKDFYVETAYKDNPMQTGVITYPALNSRTLPMLLIDITERNNEAYELGAPANVARFNCVLHLWSRDEYMRDIVEDILTSRERTVLKGIDFNSAPFPLVYANDKNPSYTSYDDLAQTSSPHFWRRIYIDQVSARRVQPYYNIERTQFDLIIRVYPNF
jgi:hypothetical protein